MISVEIKETMIELSLAALEATAGVKEKREEGGRSDRVGQVVTRVTRKVLDL